MPIIRFAREDGEEEEFVLTGGAATFGRTDDNDVVLDDFSGSRRHARIIRQDDTWILEDLGSHNGTLVNEQPISTWVLAHGDLIRIGPFHLKFQADVPPSGEETIVYRTEPPKPSSPGPGKPSERPSPSRGHPEPPATPPEPPGPPPTPEESPPLRNPH